MAVTQHSFFRYVDENFGQHTVDAMKMYASSNKKLANLETRKTFLIQCRRQGVFPSHIVNSFRCVHELLAENGPYTNKTDRTINRFKKAVLNLEIKQTLFKMKQTKKDMTEIEANIRGLTSESMTVEFVTTQRAAYNSWFSRRDKHTSRKLSNIRRGADECNENEPTFNERAILNATDLDVPANVLHLLGLGPKFALPTTSLTQVPFYHLFAETERILLTNGDKKVQDRNRCKIVNVTQNYIHGFHSMVETRDSVTKFCETATGAAKRYLRVHPEICILSADKGNRTVIMLREDYDRKMRALVEDTSTYEKLRADPTSRYQLRNNDIVKRLKNLKLIDHRTAYDLSSNNAICPHIYGQPKAHKRDLPLRPVIPNVTAPTYNLAKFVANILQSSIHSRYSTNSSFDFCKEVNDITLPAGYIMISLDVTSLFTNVPRHLVIRNIIYRWDEVTTNINLDLFLEIVAFCMEASFFCYEGQYYRQTFGTAMGSPLSPIVADIVLDSVINTAMSSLPFETTIFRKYVDDIFMVIPRDAEQQVLEAFNSVEARLQFTIETEENCKLPFLDMTVIRNPDQTLTTEWYAKPIASGRILNYRSFHQPKHKINVANNFIHRVYSLTHNQPKEEIAKTIHLHLRKNNYPKQLINRLINLYVNRRQEVTQSQQIQPHPPNTAQYPPANLPSRPSCQPSPPALHTSIVQPPQYTRSQPLCQPPTPPAIMPAIPVPHTQPASTSHHTNDINSIDHIQQAETSANRHHNTRGSNIVPADGDNTIHATPIQPEREEKIFRAIPYVPALSERISKILAKDYPNVHVTTRQHRTVNNLHSRVKFPVKQEEISNVIYRIPCNNCESSYVGMTRNNLRKRLAGHRSNVNKLETLVNDNNTNTDVARTTLIETTTALIQHCLDTDHRFDLDRTQILDHSYKPSTLPFLEMCHITNTDHTVNKRTDIDKLSTTYAAVLHNIKCLNERNRNEISNDGDNTSIGHRSHDVE